MNHPDARIEALLSALAHPALPVIDLSLARVKALMEKLGNPHHRLPPVMHVAGTNGKGSLIAYLTAILQAAGYRVHRYTSPHLVRFNERIMVAGKEIDDVYLLSLLKRVHVHAASMPVTFFEATTAAAFLAFSEMPADIVLLETGLGGRLDATNIIDTPLLTAITPVSMDHTEFLGSTIGAIAREKAGIIKQMVPCVLGLQTSEAATVIEEKAREMRAPLSRPGKEWNFEAKGEGFHFRHKTKNINLPLPHLVGEHQIANAATSVACALLLEGFSITDSHILHGITHAHWPARLQQLKEGSLAALIPPGCELWVDGGHNPAAGEILAQWAKAQAKPVHIICAMLKNKDVEGFLSPLAPYIHSLTAISIPQESQTQNPEIISAIGGKLGVKSNVGNNINNSLEYIGKYEKNDFIILICGSLYLAGYSLWQNSQNL